MTRTTDTQFNHTVQINQAQGEVGQDMAKAIKTGTKWIGDQWTNFRRLAVDTTLPPTAAA